MYIHVALLYKTFPTSLTNKRSFSRVSHPVLGKMFGLPKSGSTDFTFERFFPCVYSFVLGFVRIICKRFQASFERAFERSLTGMEELKVNLNIFFVFKCFPTFITNKGPFVTVRFFGASSTHYWMETLFRNRHRNNPVRQYVLT